MCHTFAVNKSNVRQIVGLLGVVILVIFPCALFNTKSFCLKIKTGTVFVALLFKKLIKIVPFSISPQLRLSLSSKKIKKIPEVCLFTNSHSNHLICKGISNQGRSSNLLILVLKIFDESE